MPWKTEKEGWLCVDDRGVFLRFWFGVSFRMVEPRVSCAIQLPQGRKGWEIVRYDGT